MNNLVNRLIEDGETGLDLSPGNPLSNEAANKIVRLRDAFKSIKCPSCQGSGKSPDPYDHLDTPCSGCKGTGIHPIARRSLLT